MNSLRHIVKRTKEVYYENGHVGVLRQAYRKMKYVYEQKTFRPHVITKRIAQHEIRVAINNMFTQGWVENHLDWPELDWIAKHMLRPGDIAVDCGANNGFTSVFFSRCVGKEGLVIAFEPLPSNSDDIRQNIELNGLENIDLRQQAVGAVRGEVSILNAPNGIVSNSTLNETILVPMVCLDDALIGTTPDFLKIDVEGLELEVLKGAQRILASTPMLDLEVHPVYFSDRIQHVCNVVSALKYLDYVFYLQEFIDAPIVRCDLQSWPIEKLAESDAFNVFALPKA